MHQERYPPLMNYWFWLFFIVIPAIIHGVGPKSCGLRVGRLMSAVILGYAFANAALHWQAVLDRRAFEECVAGSGLPFESREAFDACGHHVNIADGAAIVFYLFFGWIPAAAYAGFHELIWRWRHRAVIRGMGRAFKGRLMSNIVIALFLVCIAGITFLVGTALFLSA
jgi:hypothetical protein